MSKKAFIIRPFDKMFDRFCKLIMERSILETGYEPVLLKDNPQNGYIMKNVIENLAECDICLVLVTAVPDAVTGADMLNFNVAYELGIRHALKRCGTIIICEDSQKQLIEKSAFDIRDRNIVFYSANWLEDNEDEKLCEKIISLIQLAEQQKSDSPVHDCYPSLPNDLIHATTTDAQKQIAELTSELHDLRAKNQELKEKMEQFGIEGTAETRQTIDYRKELLKAMENTIFFSDHAVARLRELSLDKDHPENFVNFLGDVIEKGWLDEIDCHNVMVICHKFNPEIEKVFLKYASETYEYDEMQVQYATELAKDTRHKERALLIANEVIGLQKKGNAFTVSKDVNEKLLSAFFTVYLTLNKTQELLQIGSILLEKYQKPTMRRLIYMNMAYCYRKTDQPEECLDACEKAGAIEESSEIHYILFNMYRDHAEYAKAFHELEIANALDPSDADYYRILAGMVIDHRYARTSLDEEPHLIERTEVRNAALPYILYAVYNRYMELEVALDFMKKNIRYMKDDIPRFLSCLENGIELMEEFSDLDFSIAERSATTGFRTTSDLSE